MTSIAPPYYNELADFIDKSDMDLSIKKNVVDYIRSYNLHNYDEANPGDKNKYNSAIKVVMDKSLREAFRNSAGLLGKVNRNEGFGEEEKKKYGDVIHLIFLWTIASDWYYQG